MRRRGYVITVRLDLNFCLYRVMCVILPGVKGKAGKGGSTGLRVLYCFFWPLPVLYSYLTKQKQKLLSNEIVRV